MPPRMLSPARPSVAPKPATLADVAQLTPVQLKAYLTSVGKSFPNSWNHNMLLVAATTEFVKLNPAAATGVPAAVGVPAASGAPSAPATPLTLREQLLEWLVVFKVLSYGVFGIFFAVFSVFWMCVVKHYLSNSMHKNSDTAWNQFLPLPFDLGIVGMMAHAFYKTYFKGGGTFSQDYITHCCGVMLATLFASEQCISYAFGVFLFMDMQMGDPPLLLWTRICAAGKAVLGAWCLGYTLTTSAVVLFVNQVPWSCLCHASFGTLDFLCNRTTENESNPHWPDAEFLNLVAPHFVYHLINESRTAYRVRVLAWHDKYMRGI